MQTINLPDGRKLTLTGNETPEQLYALKNKMREKYNNPAKKIDQRLIEREQEIKRLGQSADTGEITRPEALYRQGGQIAGGLTDMIGAGVGAAASGLNEAAFGIPGQILKEGVELAGKAPAYGGGTLASDGGIQGELQRIAKGYEQIKEKHPRAMGMLEATANYAELGVPTGRGAIKKVGEGIYESGKKTALSNREKLVQELLNKKARQAAQSEGRLNQNIFGKDVIELNPLEKRAANIVNELPEFKGLNSLKPKTLASQGTIVKREAVKRAKNLQRDLIKYDNFKYKDDFLKANLVGNIKKDLYDDPNFWTTGGDLKTQPNMYVTKMLSIIDSNPKTLSGLNKSRIEFDKWATSKSPKVFDAGAETNIRQATKTIRNNINDFIAKQVPDEKVREKLMDSHALFNASDNISEKVAGSANTALKRAAQSLEEALPFKRGEMKAGAGVGLGATALAAQDAFISGGILYLGGKALTTSQAKKFIGTVINKSADVLDVSSKNALMDYLETLEENE